MQRTLEWLELWGIHKANPDPNYPNALEFIDDLIDKNWRESQKHYKALRRTHDDTQVGTSTEAILYAKERDCKDLIQCEQKGTRSWAICPFHPDKTPSLCLYGPGKGYYCHVCNASGDTIDLVMKIHNVSFYEAVRIVNNTAV